MQYLTISVWLNEFFNMNRMQVNEFCDSEKVMSLIKQYIPAAKLSGQRERELVYTLPLENVDKFPGNYTCK